MLGPGGALRRSPRWIDAFRGRARHLRTSNEGAGEIQPPDLSAPLDTRLYGLAISGEIAIPSLIEIRDASTMAPSLRFYAKLFGKPILNKPRA